MRDLYVLEARTDDGLTIRTGPHTIAEAMTVVEEHLTPGRWRHRYLSLTPMDQAVRQFNPSRQPARPVLEADFFVALRRAIIADPDHDGLDSVYVPGMLRLPQPALRATRRPVLPLVQRGRPRHLPDPARRRNHLHHGGDLMSVTLPGLGVATPISDLLGNYRRLTANLPTVIDQHPTARVVRNRAGNLAIVVGEAGSVLAVGYIDVRTGDIELWDQPWPVDTDEGVR